MLLDGSVALATGDYLGSELGPWAGLVSALGADPHSVGMRVFFVVYGLVWVGAAAWYARGGAAGRRALLFVAGGALWYAVVGTLVALLVAACVLAAEWRREPSPL